MKILLLMAMTVASAACQPNNAQETTQIMFEQNDLTNTAVRDHAFLECMYEDSYFPEFLVDRCKGILLELCRDIEAKPPAGLPELYAMTHASTEKLNDLQDEFEENDSEIETGARDCLAMDFAFIAESYGFVDADVEELIATRDW